MAIARTEDKAIGIKLEKTEVERVRCLDGVNAWSLRAIEGERVVVPVDDGNVILTEQRLHGGCVKGVGANGDEAMPKSLASDGTIS